MSQDLTVRLHEIATDGLPIMERLTGKVAFIWDGEIVSGWPLYPDHSSDRGEWEPAEDRFGGPVSGVTHWVEFPVPLHAVGGPPEPDPVPEGQDECDSCGWETRALQHAATASLGSSTRDGWMCEVCRSTMAGNAYLYPGQYPDATVLQMLAWQTNYLTARR